VTVLDVRELEFLETAAAKCKLEALAKASVICDLPCTVLVDVDVDVADVADAVDVVDAADAADVADVAGVVDAVA
jgi:hypothetical protein